MKLKEIREKETDHIKHELAEQQKHLFTLRTQSVTEKLEDPSQLGKTKRGIARLKTVLRQRVMEAQKAAAANAPATTKATVEKKAPVEKASKAKTRKPKAAKVPKVETAPA